MKKILVLCGDEVNENLTPAAKRCVGFAGALGRDFDVTLGVPNDPAVTLNGLSVKKYVYTDPVNVLELVEKNDIILAGGFDIQPFDFFRGLDKPMIFDLMMPFAIDPDDSGENGDTTIDGAQQARDTRIALSQLRAGDFFICGSEKQRDYWLGMLSALERIDQERFNEDRSLRNLIDTVPECETGIGEDAPASVIRFCTAPVKSRVKEITDDNIADEIISRLRTKKLDLYRRITTIEHKYNLLGIRMQSIEKMAADNSALIARLKSSLLYRIIKKIRKIF